MVPGSTLRYGSNFWIAHLQAAAFEQGAEGGGGEAFAEGGDDAAGDENILHGKVVGRAGSG
jgi:hypothetical protein